MHPKPKPAAKLTPRHWKYWLINFIVKNISNGGRSYPPCELCEKALEDMSKAVQRGKPFHICFRPDHTYPMKVLTHWHVEYQYPDEGNEEAE